ncbi:aminomethyl-transferring glycine dehydrogenase subunit GcvPB [Camelimonas abortus]|uniref:glycine dehydrogenase (aminomethyl-transferring) n=1 Tax=Camelimonas abortus TaxID=1017184 RepID=A0ABV7LEL3_9HYPH
MNARRGPSAPAAACGGPQPATFTGNRALQQVEPLLFETGSYDRCGVDLDGPPPFTPRLGGMAAEEPVKLPALSEPETMRHYVRLSQKNYSIDTGMFPLGSCTMKHNPRLNEKVARLPGFADVHPLQPVSTVQGALEVMETLGQWLMTLTGMPAVALSAKAGAHGELLGMMAIRAALAARGEAATRTVVLAPESAHGTNPATAAQLGFTVRAVPAGPDGAVRARDVAPLLGPDVGAIMFTNPTTCGLFEPEIEQIARLARDAGAYFYCDGANFNAIVGRVRPGDLGVDAMHINLHKTFSTPHGGGGPGAGPVALSERLAPFAPAPFVRRREDGSLTLVEHAGEGEAAQAFGRLCAFHGQMGMFVRALAYMLSHGGEGLRQASGDAVLAANYLAVSLGDVLSAPFGSRRCMHEALFDDAWLKGTGITTLDVAKALIDEGFHPMTVYFPLVVSGAMLVEPTESESRASLDLFIAAMRDLAMAARNGDVARFTGAPRYAPVRRLDETRAARQPVLRWKPPQPVA